jgi:hypothetical protein
MSKLVECIATREWSGWKECVRTWDDTADKFHPQQIVANTDVLSAYQICYKRSREPILGFMHDDLVIFEQGWDTRVVNSFSDPRVGVVGFGGSMGHGTPDLYSSPYHLPNLARQQFLSNMRSAETHGGRFTGDRDVAAIDGFAIFVRREILDKHKGWPLTEPYGYYLYTEWLTCEARRQGYRIRLVGVDCEHLGGKTSTLVQVKDNFELAHRYLYDHNSDVLPYRVPE